MCLLGATCLTPLGRRQIHATDAAFWLAAAAFGYACWRFLFDHVAGSRRSRALTVLAGASFVLYVGLAFVSIGFSRLMGSLPDMPVVFFIVRDPSYSAAMVVDRFKGLPIALLLVVLALAVYAVRQATRALSRPPLGRLPAVLGLFLVVPLSMAARAQHGLESHFLVVAGQVLSEIGRPPVFDEFILTRPRLGPQSCRRPDPPNIVWFQLEEIAHDRFGRAANGRVTDPFLDDLMTRDPRHFQFLENHYANSGATEVSIYSMLLGLDAAQGGRRLGRMPVVWDYLQACGYTTLYSVPFDLGWAGLGDRLKRTDGTFGLDYLFDTKTKQIRRDYELAVKDERAVDWFLEALPDVADRGRPFFAIINLQTSHSMGGAVSLLGKQQFACGRDEPGFDAYECGVYEIDAQIRRVMAALTERGILDNTVVMGTPDHGADVKRRRTRLESFLQEIVHVPFFMYLPERLLAQSPNLVVNRSKLTQHADLVPTILDIVGFERDAETAEFLDAFTGTSIFSPKEPRALFFVNVNTMREWRRYGFAVLYEGRYKYIVSEGNRELYDILADPHEEHNVIRQPGLEREKLEIGSFVEGNPVLRRAKVRTE